jgi:beta-glucosidase
LPLKKKGQKIALIGSLADDKTSPLGSWRTGADDNTAVSVKEGMQKYKENILTYAKGADVILGTARFVSKLNINSTDKSGFSEAIEIAKDADVVVMVLGEHGLQSGEGRSRTNIGIPGVQQDLLEEIYEVNKNIVLVLTNGRPLTISWADDHIPAIVEAWHLGTQSGNAIAEVLYGDYNPSGKLPVTFPRTVGQVPIYYNYKNTGRPHEKEKNSVFWSHYSDEKNEPLYPFGYGLSYTSFSYSDIIIENNYSSNQTVTAKIEISNSGKLTGKEVVQLYINDCFASITRPVKELKGFEIVKLEPGESKEVTFTLTDKEFGFYDNQGEWIVEPGEFNIYIGGDSMTKNQVKIELKS